MPKKVLPPTYLVMFIIVAVLVHFVLPGAVILAMPWRLAGLLPIILGAALNLAADRSFKKRKTTVKPFEESAVLVTDGVFRLSRHPMYLGFVLILLGIAILLGSVSPYLVVILFGIFLEFVFIREEEQMLSRQFPGEWEDYRKNIRKWI